MIFSQRTGSPKARRGVGASAAVAGVMVGFATVRLSAGAAPETIDWWVTTEDRKLQLAQQPALAWQSTTNREGQCLVINPEETFQTLLGLGSSLEPSTCSNLWRLTPPDRERTMERLVSPTAGIGMNLMRVCIGTPDFTGDPWYSYDDLPPGQTDPELQRFSIERDRLYILPALKLARQRNPALVLCLAVEPAGLDEEHRHDDRRLSAAGRVSRVRGILRELHPRL